MSIDFNTIDPNLVYLALIYGLWTGATAVYVPGTGILEAKAFAVLALAIAVLTQLDVNWLAVLLIVIGVSVFIAIPFLKREYANTALSGLILQGIGGLLLFESQQVSPFIIALTLIAPFAYFRYVLIPMLDKLRDEHVADKDDLLIGEMGVVTRAIDPVGAVNVNSELWTATSDSQIEAGAAVIVVERSGLQLRVEALKEKRDG